MARYECTVCGYIYDEEKEGTPWNRLPEDWVCPLCGSEKVYFKLVEESPAEVPAVGRKLRCSVCGYIMEGDFSGDECPACGALKAAFQPWEDRMSPKRRKILDLHMHSIVVHFPQAFSVFMFFLTAALFFLEGLMKVQFWMTLTVLSIFLPLSTAAAVISGMIDGKTRFKRLSTIILKRKIAAGVVLFILSTGIFLVLNFIEMAQVYHVELLVLNGLCALTSVFLGRNGGRLVGMETPG
jgi:rubredoxin